MNDKKVKLENLAIELTKRCNLDCAHCLKGESQKVDIFKETNVSKDSILNIVRNSKNVVFFDDLGEFYDDMEKQYEAYQDSFSFEEVEEH